MSRLIQETLVSTPAAASWRPAIAPYAQADLRRSLLGLATSVLPYLLLTAVMWRLVLTGAPYWATLLVALPAGGFLLRTFIVFHDCTHGSYFKTKRGNHLVGSVVGLLVYTPFLAWRHDHAMHHATTGDLDRRGGGDVETITVDEYRARSPRGRLAYRLFRNPLVMFGVGWVWALILQPRILDRSDRPRIQRSALGTDVALVVAIGALCWLFGWQAFLLVQVPATFVAGASGVFLFYVQHQFEDAYWETRPEWDYADAALRGSSHLKLPKVLQFFSGNIGLHHVHHLSARVPNYNLQRAHDELNLFRSVPSISLWDGVKASRLKVWSIEDRRLLTWREVRAGR